MDVSLNQTDDTCRCCLKSGNLISIFEETEEDIEIFKMLIEIVPVQISRNDGYSQNICVDCKNDLHKFFNFRLMCISSDENMRSNRRPVSRNNEHDYSTWKIDEYDMDLSEYLIEGSSPEHFVETQIIERAERTYETSFDETQNFDISLKKKTRKSYSCPICGKLWVTPSKLKRHLGSHKSSPKEKSTESPKLQKIQCPICNSLLDSPQQLTQHMARSHVKVMFENTPEYDNGIPLAQKIGARYICTICGFEFFCPSKLKNHMKTFHMKPVDLSMNKAKHVCQFCHKVLVTPSKLQRHLRTHTKIIDRNRKIRRPLRRHECINCGKKFETPSKLHRHMTSVHRDSTQSVNSKDVSPETSTVTSL